MFSAQNIPVVSCYCWGSRAMAASWIFKFLLCMAGGELAIFERSTFGTSLRAKNQHKPAVFRLGPKTFARDINPNL